MQPLERSLRNILERTVKSARDTADVAARAALDQLGVGEASPYPYLSESERELRRKLRAHGRQLGDVRNSRTEAQELDRLTEEVAYEHWHRMLFARFLAENNLLMYPDPVDPVAVTLEECEDLATDEGAANGWELASRYAAKMLPQIFRPDSPVFQLTLPPEHQLRLEKMVADLSEEVFTASDSLGWVYQFWQAKKKDEVNASEVKIGARELPAVTQLFTEPYMVSFLLDNSLGAWWAARRLSEADLKSAESEEDLRSIAALPGVSLDYLRFVRADDSSWTPAAGTFEGWPEHLSELKTLDPCCGSGHFLVSALLMLVPMRMEMEGLSAREAVDAVLEENIHGLEIDQRCVELAAFALALNAWRYSDAGGYRTLPELNLACSGLAIGVTREAWVSLAGENNNLRIALDQLYSQFIDAPTLGSLIDLNVGLATGSLLEVQWKEVSPLLTHVSSGMNDQKAEMGVVAHGLSKAADILSKKMLWIITNVPYLSRVKHDEGLKQLLDLRFHNAKGDLATAFVDRLTKSLSDKGALALVVPQNWLFQPTYRQFRTELLKDYAWNTIARLGAGAFETISGEVVKAILLVLQNKRPVASQSFAAIDASDVSGANNKAREIIWGTLTILDQRSQRDNPDSRIILGEASGFELLDRYANAWQGICTGDYPRFGRVFWEFDKVDSSWELQISTVSGCELYGGRTNVLRWDGGAGEFFEYLNERLGVNHGAWVRGLEAWGQNGIVISQTNDLPVTLYTGESFDNNAAVMVPNDQGDLAALWAYCSSNEYHESVREIDQALKVTNKTLVKVPFEADRWRSVAELNYPNGLPKPYSNDPTQWIFHGNPAQSDEPLQVAVARLLGSRWPAELDPEMELSDEARTWVQMSETLLPFADRDGIICIPPVRGEASAADRLMHVLATAYGDNWNNDRLSQLLAQAEHAGRTLETWLRDKFFTQHYKLFHHRPFIWHIWDGLRDGFAALVNYHKLDAKLLETLIYTYLGDWINRQNQDIVRGVDGAQEKLAAAEQLKRRLELILEGEDPYDIFVRWKPLEKQPIGWNPDLNDGVRMNIRPFLSVPDIGKKGAGVLRDKPNIKWDKDRGKDVSSAPWYHLFDGDRKNDHHLSLAQKKAAQGKTR